MCVFIGRFDAQGTQYSSLWPLQNTTITTTITTVNTLWPAEVKTGRNVSRKNTYRLTTNTCLCSYLLLTCTSCSAEVYTASQNKKLIRRWDSERELSVRRHRTRTTKYNRLVHSATDRRGGYVWKAYLPNSVK